MARLPNLERLPGSAKRYRDRRTGEAYSYRQALKLKEQRAEPVRSRAAFSRLTPRQQQAQQRATRAISLHRRTGISLSQAAEREGTSLHAIRQYGGDVVARAPSGRYTTRPRDRLYRVMSVTTTHGVQVIAVTDSNTASRIGEYANAVRQYLRTGETRRLRTFRGKSFRAGKQVYFFETDPRVLDELAARGDLSFESLYPMAA